MDSYRQDVSNSSRAQIEIPGHGSVKRVGSAVGEGATAVQLVHQYLAEQEGATAPALVETAT